MDPVEHLPQEPLLQNNALGIIQPEQYEAHGIVSSDIPLGTFPALRHPPQFPSRFGGNAYGFGLYEVQQRLTTKDIELLQSIHYERPEDIRRYYKELNRIYKQLGLLIRFSRLGKPYYLIPAHLISVTVTHLRTKVEKIGEVIQFHHRKSLKEQHVIGMLTQTDDLVFQELSYRFKDHRLAAIDSLDRLRTLDDTLDLVVLTSDPYELLLNPEFCPQVSENPSKDRLNQYTVYVFKRIWDLLKQEGEIFIIANHYPPRSARSMDITFNTEQEKKRFALFTHIFRTRGKYRIQDSTIHVNIFDFQKFLTGLYVEQEVVQRLLGGKSLEELSLEQIAQLPYLNYPLTNPPFLGNQKSVWSSNLSVFFEKILLEPIVPDPVREDWEERFSFDDYMPDYMIQYLGQRKRPQAAAAEVRRDVQETRLAGCMPELLADYRDSFDYVISTLRVLSRLKTGKHEGLPQLLVDRLRQPLENRKRRFKALNHVIKLMGKTGRMEDVRGYLNPGRIEGPRTNILENIEALSFFGFSSPELREILLIVLGHTPMGRIISGKMNEKSLKPLTDLAKRFETQEALNLLRYCRLMTMAENEASRGVPLTEPEILELFQLYESSVRVVLNRDFDWETLLDENVASMGGIHNKIIRKLLKMMNHSQFLENWSELRDKGAMEKESIADYDEEQLSKIENVIRLVETVDDFEHRYLQAEPLQLPVFYRRLLDIEFHGTGRLFQRMDSRLVFTLLWIAGNVARGDTINFNPMFRDLPASGDEDEWIKRIEREATAINLYYLDLNILKQFSQQIYETHSSFLVGTGIHFKVNTRTQALEIGYTDMDNTISSLDSLSKVIEGKRISEIPIEDFEKLEVRFSSLESFYQSHLRLISQPDFAFKLPQKQKQWFKKVDEQRKNLHRNFLKTIFQPEELHTDLDLMYRHAPSVLHFILPEFLVLKDLSSPGHLYLKGPVTNYIKTTTKKLQALIRREKEQFQNLHFLHRLAQREFGPMTAGTVGVSEAQIEQLEAIVEHLRTNTPLFHALILSFIFQDVGRIPALRDKYKKDINPADLAYNGALFLEKEHIPERHGLDEQAKAYLIFLVRHHGLLHHIIRGETSLFALQDILRPEQESPDVFDAFFLLSFIVLSAIREDLILEDLADWLFNIRSLCHRVMAGETSFDSEFEKIFLDRGNLFFALEEYTEQGLPDGVPAVEYLDFNGWNVPETRDSIQAGKMIFAMERIFRLRGLRHIQFADLVRVILEVPLQYIYKKRNFSSIGYATFEKETYEAQRLYKTLRNLTEDARHYILDRLVGDKIRIFGYEKISGYLSYENQIKLLLIALLGAERIKGDEGPAQLNFMQMTEIIEKRYEAVNDYLNMLSMDKLWSDQTQTDRLFRAENGILLREEEFPGVLSIRFRDHRINISEKIAYMKRINHVDQLKNYFHYSLRSLRKLPFYTEDYELELEKAFEGRLAEITETILEQTKKRMDLIEDFEELHSLVSDLLERALDIGFSEDQIHRLNDLYELRKDILKRSRLQEMENVLDRIQDMHELRDYWESIKPYLQANRMFLGKELETLIARKFDAAIRRLQKAPPE